MEALKAARQKYLLLGREIEAMPSSLDRDNALHSHSKLGIFLSTALGDAWDQPRCGAQREYKPSLPGLLVACSLPKDHEGPHRDAATSYEWFDSPAPVELRLESERFK